MAYNGPISLFSYLSFAIVLRCCQHWSDVLTVSLLFLLSLNTLLFPSDYKTKTDRFVGAPTGFSPFQQHECLYCSLNAFLQKLSESIYVALMLETCGNVKKYIFFLLLLFLYSMFHPVKSIDLIKQTTYNYSSFLITVRYTSRNSHFQCKFSRQRRTHNSLSA